MPEIISTSTRRKVITLGEVMMRLSCPGQGRFTQADSFDVIYAGSEANIAAALAGWNIPAAHITAFPDHDLGTAATNYLRQFGVDTQYIRYQPGRLGIYFLESGASIRSPKIIYDRFNSCFANVNPTQFDWSEIFRDATWFHYSGITPAISQAAADVCLEAVKMARKKGVTVSGDINYRRNLWQYGKAVREIMPELIKHTDVIVAGITDFDNCLGIADETFESTCEKVVRQYKDIRKIFTSIRKTVSASHNMFGAMLWNGKKTIEAKTYDLIPIVDRVGTGDAFMAGYIFGAINQFDDQRALEFATAAGALKHTIEGDVTTCSVEEIVALMEGENVGKLLR
jgi:2-dehydro-3-deoxygluconokinase